MRDVTVEMFCFPMNFYVFCINGGVVVKHHITAARINRYPDISMNFAQVRRAASRTGTICCDLSSSVRNIHITGKRNIRPRSHQSQFCQTPSERVILFKLLFMFLLHYHVRHSLYMAVVLHQLARSVTVIIYVKFRLHCTNRLENLYLHKP